MRRALTVESTIVLGNFSSFEGVNHAMQRLRVIGIDQFLRDVGFPLFPIIRITEEESGPESFQCPMKRLGTINMAHSASIERHSSCGPRRT